MIWLFSLGIRNGRRDTPLAKDGEGDNWHTDFHGF